MRNIAITKIRMQTAVQGLGVLLCAVALAGCSSRPEAADIQKELAQVYSCPILVLSAVAKVDGAEAGRNQYDVAFTHTISIKGGAEAAAKLFGEWSRLAAASGTAQMAHEQAQMAQADQQFHGQGMSSGVVSGSAINGNPVVQQTAATSQQINNQLNALVPCEGMEEIMRLQIMLGTAEEAAKSGQVQLEVPVAVKLRGSGRMAKAESGWRFTGAPAFNTVEIVSAPVAYPRHEPVARAAAPTVPVASEPQKAEAAAEITPKNASNAPCVVTKMAALEKKREQEMDELSKEAQAKGEELHISAGQEAMAHDEAQGQAEQECAK